MTADEKRYGLHERLIERLGERMGDALYTFVACLLAIGVSGLAAYLTKQPLLFPSPGPTAFLFFDTQTALAASPRNALVGHAVAILAGAVLLLLRSSHPPTGATTLIASLGFLQTPPEMAALMVGVVLLTAVGWLINRASGGPVPLWAREAPERA